MSKFVIVGVVALALFWVYSYVFPELFLTWRGSLMFLSAFFIGQLSGETIAYVYRKN